MYNFVYIDEYGILGSNFYWNKYAEKGLTKEEIMNAGVTSDRVQVHKDIIEALVNVDKEFQKRGMRLYVKEGYRPKALYEIMYKRRVEKFGKEETDMLINMTDMPHATGKSVDVALWDEKENKEVYMRNFADGADALFTDFYRDKTDAQSQKYQELQDFVSDVMGQNGFRVGGRKEYFHFNYRNI